MKVLFITNLPSPYRVDFFIELSKHCNLTVFFEAKRSRTRKFNWNEDKISSFKYHFFSELFFEKKILVSLIYKVVFGKYDKIFISSYYTRTQSILIILLKLFRKKYYFETDGGLIPKKESKINHFLKRLLISGASKYFSSGKLCDDYLIHYGAKKDRVMRYTFTSLDEEDIISNVPNQSEKERLKKNLGIKESKVVISVGRYIPVKGLDILIKSATHVPRNVGIYIIGDNPPSEYVNLVKDKKLNNVNFIGFVSKKKLSDWYKASDIFVMPTRGDVWGLVVNEAMANGLPVLSSESCPAGVELIPDKKCLYKTEDIGELGELITEIINNDDYRNKLSINNLIAIKNKTIKVMAKEHIDEIYKV